MRPLTNDRPRLNRNTRIWAAALVVASLLLTSNAALDTVALGRHDEETQYVFLAPLLIGWLAWVRRSRLVYCKNGGNWLGLAMMAAGWLAWSLGYRRSVPTLWHGGPVLLAAGAVVAVAGTDMFRRFAPAFVALAFAVPITPTRRQIIAAPLERYAAQWTQSGCELLGLDVARSGNLLSVNGVNLEVAEACNGMRMVITFWLLCYLVCFSQPWRWYTRTVILLAVPAVAVAANVARLVPTVWAYSHGAGETAERWHTAAGWIALAVAFVILHGTLAALRWAGVPLQRYQSLLA